MVVNLCRAGAPLRHRVMLECEVGDFDQSRAFMERFLVAPVSVPTVSGYVAMVIPLFSRITGVVSRLDMAKEAAEAILSSASSTPAVDEQPAVQYPSGLFLFPQFPRNSP